MSCSSVLTQFCSVLTYSDWLNRQGHIKRALLRVPWFSKCIITSFTHRLTNLLGGEKFEKIKKNELIIIKKSLGICTVGSRDRLGISVLDDSDNGVGAGRHRLWRHLGVVGRQHRLWHRLVHPTRELPLIKDKLKLVLLYCTKLKFIKKICKTQPGHRHTEGAEGKPPQKSTPAVVHTQFQSGVPCRPGELANSLRSQPFLLSFCKDLDQSMIWDLSAKVDSQRTKVKIVRKAWKWLCVQYILVREYAAPTSR